MHSDLLDQWGKLTLNFDTSQVEDINGMFAGTSSDINELKGLNFSKLKKAEYVFTDNRILIFNRIQIGVEQPELLFQVVPHRIVIKNCDENVVNWIKKKRLTVRAKKL